MFLEGVRVSVSALTSETSSSRLSISISDTLNSNKRPSRASCLWAKEKEEKLSSKMRLLGYKSCSVGSSVSVPPGARAMVLWVLLNTRPPLFPAGFWMDSAFLCVRSSKHTAKLVSKLRCFYCVRIPQASFGPSSTMFFTLLDLMEVLWLFTFAHIQKIYYELDFGNSMGTVSKSFSVKRRKYTCGQVSIFVPIYFRKK